MCQPWLDDASSPETNPWTTVHNGRKCKCNVKMAGRELCRERVRSSEELSIASSITVPPIELTLPRSGASVAVAVVVLVASSSAPMTPQPERTLALSWTTIVRPA